MRGSLYRTKVDIGLNRRSLGRGGGQVVSILAFSSNDPSSKPAEEAGVGPFLTGGLGSVENSFQL